MTEQEINIAIAEHCGWTPGIPNYCGDLNACHEMEKVLKPEQWRYYSDKLMVAVRDSDLTLNGSNIEARYKTPHATARQRSEAFLRTLGLWKD